MLNLQATTWLRFGVWMAVGLLVYFVYSARHSGVARRAEAGPEQAADNSVDPVAT